MSQAVTAFFDTRFQAVDAIDALVDAGIPRTDLQLLPESTTPAATGPGRYDVNRDEHGFWASLSEFLFPEDDLYNYTEALHRGSIMVVATVEDKDVAKVTGILQRDGRIELSQRQQEWQENGWTMPARSEALKRRTG